MLRDYGFEDGKLVVRASGEKIPLTREFMRDAAAVASFALEVSAISAARAARSRVIALKWHEAPLRICFTPATPQVWHTIWSVCHLAGMEIVREARDADIVFCFDTRERIASMLPEAINGQCLDISKSHIADAFHAVFGYPVDIEPRTGRGFAVMKSDRNGMSDGQIVPLPFAAPRAGSVYQRLIDNSEDGRLYTEYTLTVVGTSLPVAYRKQRSAAHRLSGEIAAITLAEPRTVLSSEEHDRILSFALGIGLDFGGLDVLRDGKDGRIYVVDVDKTDMGPPASLPRSQKMIAMQRLADAFRLHVTTMLEQHRAA